MRVRPLQRIWLCLLCISLLMMRVDGAHLHLCFDGKEPPVSLHTDDMGMHSEHEAANPHSDREIYLATNALIKKTGSEFVFNPAILAALPLLWIFALVYNAIGLLIPRQRRAPISFNPVSFAFHPPSHAPPR